MAGLFHSFPHVLDGVHAEPTAPAPLVHSLAGRTRDARRTDRCSVLQGAENLPESHTAHYRWRNGEPDGGGHRSHTGVQLPFVDCMEWPTRCHHRSCAPVSHARARSVRRTRVHDIRYGNQRGPFHFPAEIQCSPNALLLKFHSNFPLC